MKKIILIMTMITLGLSVAVNAREWRGSTVIDTTQPDRTYIRSYFTDDERPHGVTHRGIISGENLRDGMGQYKTRGYFGGWITNEDGTVEYYSYTTED